MKIEIIRETLKNKSLKKESKATIRCIPMDYGKNPGKCIVTGKKSNGLVVFGKAY